MIGVITFSTTEVMTFPNAAPITTPTARSTMFPFRAKVLNSCQSEATGRYERGMGMRSSGAFRGAADLTGKASRRAAGLVKNDRRGRQNWRGVMLSDAMTRFGPGFFPVVVFPAQDQRHQGQAVEV